MYFSVRVSYLRSAFRISYFVFRISYFVFRISYFVSRISYFVIGGIKKFVFRIWSNLAFAFRIWSFVFRISSWGFRIWSARCPTPASPTTTCGPSGPPCHHGPTSGDPDCSTQAYHPGPPSRPPLVGPVGRHVTMGPQVVTPTAAPKLAIPDHHLWAAWAPGRAHKHKPTSKPSLGHVFFERFSFLF